MEIWSSSSFDEFDFAGCIAHEDEAVATFSVVEHGFVSEIPAPSACVRHLSTCQKFTTGLEHEEEVESRYCLRGVRVGEVSHPGPPPTAHFETDRRQRCDPQDALRWSHTGA